ncbi:hypothetical protein phiB5_02 [Propionibacterium phage B5]|uniref:Orf2 n=1 Tax=Propionibacterium phage B5 TaxID=189836 RepID=Q8SCI4_9VIRU|nr:hypothetical protein phiB5_02 [Propionibacterium phage B5]AAL91695.1 Orf2 [Propionibacterium phage B5]
MPGVVPVPVVGSAGVEPWCARVGSSWTGLVGGTAVCAPPRSRRLLAWCCPCCRRWWRCHPRHHRRRRRGCLCRVVRPGCSGWSGAWGGQASAWRWLWVVASTRIGWLTDACQLAAVAWSFVFPWYFAVPGGQFVSDSGAYGYCHGVPVLALVAVAGACGVIGAGRRVAGVLVPGAGLCGSVPRDDRGAGPGMSVVVTASVVCGALWVLVSSVVTMDRGL